MTDSERTITISDALPNKGAASPLKFRTLSAKLIAIYLPLVSLSVMVLFGVLEARFYAGKQDQLEYSLQEVARLQASNLAEAVWEYDTDAIESTLKNLERLPHFHRAAVLDSENTTIVERGAKADAVGSDTSSLRQPLKFVRGNVEEPVGFLVLTFHQRAIRTELRERLQADLLILTILAVTVLAVTIFAVRFVVGRPLRVLKASIDANRTNQSHDPVPWQDSDEIGDVISAYNELLQRQGEVEADLRAVQEELEQRVAERTSELTAKEDQLRAALDHMSCGLFVVDKDMKVRLFNQQLIDLYDLPPGTVGQGSPLELILRARAERGEYGLGDIEKKIQDRLKGYSDRRVTQVEDEVAGGKVIDARRAPTDDGGVVIVLNDITERKRTEEMMRKNVRELERFNRLATGRELRMIELKEEINALLEAQGKEPKYEVVE